MPTPEERIAAIKEGGVTTDEMGEVNKVAFYPLDISPILRDYRARFDSLR